MQFMPVAQLQLSLSGSVTSVEVVGEVVGGGWQTWEVGVLTHVPLEGHTTPMQ